MRGAYLGLFILVCWHFKDRFFKFKTYYFSHKNISNLIKNQTRFSAAKLIETDSISYKFAPSIKTDKPPTFLLNWEKEILDLESKLNGCLKFAEHSGMF